MAPGPFAIIHGLTWETSGRTCGAQGAGLGFAEDGWKCSCPWQLPGQPGRGEQRGMMGGGQPGCRVFLLSECSKAESLCVLEDQFAELLSECSAFEALPSLCPYVPFFLCKWKGFFPPQIQSVVSMCSLSCFCLWWENRGGRLS